MATEERLPPACAFALSVLAEYEQNPEAVPEEAVEAAQQHITTCQRCTSAHIQMPTAAPRKKRKVRRLAETSADAYTDSYTHASLQTLIEESPAPVERRQEQTITIPPANAALPAAKAPPVAPLESPDALMLALAQEPGMVVGDGIIDCQQCRTQLRKYAEALDNGENAPMLYPEVQDHLFACESGCLVMLDLYREEAKSTRKYRRRLVRNPFGIIWWQLTGFFRRGQLPVAPMALSYGTLILILLFTTFSVYWSIRWDDARYYVPPPHTIATPDGIGLSDGLHVYDACNAKGYQDKRTAAQLMQQKNLSGADQQLGQARDSTLTDTSGCNGAEAAIYREDLHIRQSGRAYSIVVVSFDSGPGNADPQGGTDRHILYGAYTQELVGAYISQQQYNQQQMQKPNAPLMYLVLANTTGVEQGALQIANSVADMVHIVDVQQMGLLASGSHRILGVLGLGPSKLAQVVLPVMCRTGVPMIVPTSTGIYIIDLLTQTSLYRHCAPGFAFIRFSPDDARQSSLAASYAYNQLHVHNAAIFYDPSNPSSQGAAQSFSSSFTKLSDAHIVAQESAVASGLLDANGNPQASRADLLAGLNDALKAKTRPQLIFAPLLTNDVVALGQAIAQLPTDQQPILMIGGEFVQPAALQKLVQWVRQQQLTLPNIFVSISSAVHPPQSDWQKQFYAGFCTSFATPGSFCSGTAALDQGALFFADGIEILAKAVGSISSDSQFPTAAQLVKHIVAEKFDGVSCPIALQINNDILVTSTRAVPVMLGIQGDGNLQIVG